MACPSAWFQNKFFGPTGVREVSESAGIQSGDELKAGNRSSSLSCDLLNLRIAFLHQTIDFTRFRT
jgi:hypothetical protein